MPKKKNNIFDNRDAFEILRDAFWGAKTPVIAELGTRPVKARTVAADKYREEITPEDLLNQRKERQAGKAKKRNPYDSDEEPIELKTFWSEQPEPNVEQNKELDPVAQTEKAARTDLKAEKSLPERLVAIEQQREKLSPEEHAQFDAILEKAKQQIQGVKPPIETPPPSESTPAETIPPPFASEPLKPKPAPTPEDTALVEQYKQSLAEKVAEHYQKEYGENTLLEMEKLIQYRSKNKTKNGETDTEGIDRLQRAVEIVKARAAVPLTREPVPEPPLAPPLLSPEPTPEPILAVTTFDPGAPTLFEKQGIKQEEEDERTEAAHKSDMRSPQPLSPEDLPKTESRYEKRIIKLEKHINETGGTPEERKEHWALQKAKEYHYSVSEMNARVDELKKERAGMRAMEMQTLADALNLLKPESPTPEPTPAPEAVRIPEATKETTPSPSIPEAKQETIPVETDKAFEEFGISKDDLAHVKGFATLDDNQKAFVFENLRRVLYGDIETRAKAMLAEETSKQSGLRRTGRKAFEGFAGQGGKLAVKEAEALKAIRTGGIIAHGETLRLLVQMTRGHEIVTNPDTGAL